MSYCRVETSSIATYELYSGRYISDFFFCNPVSMLVKECLKFMKMIKYTLQNTT